MTTTQPKKTAKSKLLASPREIKRQFPLSDKSRKLIQKSRKEIKDIILGKDKRKLLIVGPCSIHDVNEAKEYAHLLKELADRVQDKFLIVMRAYIEKPRTKMGWTGLIHEPDIKKPFNLNKGLKISRQLLVDLTAIGVALGVEIVTPSLIPYYIDLVSWATIGARTVESPHHRHVVSSLNLPVGFKNTPQGEIIPAINAISTAREQQCFALVNDEGRLTEHHSSGNPYCHLVLRGGATPNFSQEHIRLCQKELQQSGLDPLIMVDCSHGNSGKNHINQPNVFFSVIQQMKTNKHIFSVMIESNLVEGSQDPHQEQLQKGVSITDSCLGWEKTEEIILRAYEMV
ncbi:MAG TPA: 3-deoxy-7-phosphoheptulonate synthase [Candidatus Nanoarchaeia archaeon]|nr:3-deoxy-7-phosphoheptulonate synthase [Candidatus Nanoarchaeia archaeon]